MSPRESKILVIDDNADNRALARATLEDEGYQVVLAQSGAEGLQAFEAQPADCVLLDVRMPGMDGFATCERLRKLPSGADTPIVFLTALRDIDTFDEALRAGADDFLTKPVRPAELVVRIQAALKLRKMSDELREHYDLVRKQRDDLMRLQLQKERLMAFVVHDLKNPVNAMDLHAQVLLHDKELPAHVRHSAQHIRDAARSLTRMVLNLLDLSRSEEGTLVPRRGQVDLVALVADLQSAFEERARGAGVRIESQLEARVLEADSDLLRRVLENLLDNALRHAPAQSVVRISAQAAAGCAGYVDVRVADAGSGVAADQREKIFERFVQVEHNERLVTRTGRGLGLAFCKMAVEAHGGQIRVEDAAPGAAFCMRWPQ